MDVIFIDPAFPDGTVIVSVPPVTATLPVQLGAILHWPMVADVQEAILLPLLKSAALLGGRASVSDTIIEAAMIK